MYVPSGRFENARYSEIYGYDPNATKGDLRRQGRQFRRYLRTDAADFDRALYEASEQARIDENMLAQSDAFARDLADRTRTPIETKPTMTEEEILAQEAEMNAHREDLRMRDLEARIAGSARFGDAFRLARQSGLKTFKWRGRLYGTQLATEVNSGAGRRPAAPATPAAPAAPAKPAAPATPAPAPTAPASGSGSGSGTKSTGGWREVTPAKSGPANGWTTEMFYGHPNFRRSHGAGRDETIVINGVTYPMAVTTGALGIPDLANDHIYAFDPKTGLIRKVSESWIFGGPRIPVGGGGSQFERGSKWMDPAVIFGKQKTTKTPTGVNQGAGGGIAHRRNGGLIPRVNYFQ